MLYLYISYMAYMCHNILVSVYLLFTVAIHWGQPPGICDSNMSIYIPLVWDQWSRYRSVRSTEINNEHRGDIDTPKK